MAVGATPIEMAARIVVRGAVEVRPPAEVVRRRLRRMLVRLMLGGIGLAAAWWLLV